MRLARRDVKQSAQCNNTATRSTCRRRVVPEIELTANEDEEEEEEVQTHSQGNTPTAGDDWACDRTLQVMGMSARTLRMAMNDELLAAQMARLRK